MLENEDIRDADRRPTSSRRSTPTSTSPRELASALPPRLRRSPARRQRPPQRRRARRRTASSSARACRRSGRTANRSTAQQFINIAEDKSRAITTVGRRGRPRPAHRSCWTSCSALGLPGTLAGKIPESAGKIRVMSADQVETTSRRSPAAEEPGVVLPFLALGSLGARRVPRARTPAADAASGRASALIVAGAVVLVIRNLAGEAIVERLASPESARAGGTGRLGHRQRHAARRRPGDDHRRDPARARRAARGPDARRDEPAPPHGPVARASGSASTYAVVAVASWSSSRGGRSRRPGS